MDPQHARELLAAERRRLEALLAGRKPFDDGEFDRSDEADLGSDTYIEELDEGLADQLREELEAVERAEKRLDEGTYGLSVESGEPIPDERLEVNPTAERTAAEQDRFEGRVT
jgi:DnaK suppressor protein